MAQGLTLATPLIAAPHYLRQLQRRAQNGADVDFLVDGGITGTRKNRQQGHQGFGHGSADRGKYGAGDAFGNFLVFRRDVQAR